MATITVQAVYHKGALRPKKKLDLPEDTLVEVQVTPLAAGARGFAALKGIWRHLSDPQVEQAVSDLAKTRQQSAKKIEQLARNAPEAGQE